MKRMLDRALSDLGDLLPTLAPMNDSLERLGHAMLECWANRGKVLVAGNGGSAADAMHLAEELSVRFQKNRRGLAAMALLDPTVITCAGNDFGYESIFARQVEGLGNPGDIFIAFTTSGNSPNMLAALARARDQQLVTVGFLGRDGGKANALCDIAFVVSSNQTCRIQEAHKVLYHTLCEWVDERVD